PDPSSSCSMIVSVVKMQTQQNETQLLLFTSLHFPLSRNSPANVQESIRKKKLHLLPCQSITREPSNTLLLQTFLFYGPSLVTLVYLLSISQYQYLFLYANLRLRLSFTIHYHFVMFFLFI